MQFIFALLQEHSKKFTSTQFDDLTCKYRTCIHGMGVVPGSNTFTNMQGSYFLFENKILKKITSIQYTCFLVKRDIDATHLDLKEI